MVKPPHATRSGRLRQRDRAGRGHRSRRVRAQDRGENPPRAAVPDRWSLAIESAARLLSPDRSNRCSLGSCKRQARRLASAIVRAAVAASSQRHGCDRAVGTTVAIALRPPPARSDSPVWRTIQTAVVGGTPNGGDYEAPAHLADLAGHDTSDCAPGPAADGLELFCFAGLDSRLSRCSGLSQLTASEPLIALRRDFCVCSRRARPAPMQ